MKVRVSEHQGVSPRTGKHLKGTLSTSMRDHMLDCNHVVAWMTLKFWGGILIIGFWRLRRVYFFKIDRPSLNKKYLLPGNVSILVL